ncbi:hypothetical protein C0416_02985 [bacterium]|nr:hypothetical protein [bacterium]
MSQKTPEPCLDPLFDPQSEAIINQVQSTGFEAGFKSEFPEYDEYGPKINKLVEEKILTEEEKTTLFATLERRFNAENTPLKEFHGKLDWNKVKTSLEADEKALLKVYKMEEAGHEPDVYDFDGSGFRIGTCSIESPEKQRNCTYPESLEMANEIGIEHMTALQYKAMQRNGKIKFDKKTWSWLKAPEDAMPDEVITALVGAVYFGQVKIYPARPEDKGELGSWRGTLTVNWAD